LGAIVERAARWKENTLRIGSAAELRGKKFPALKYIVPEILAEGCTLIAGRPKLGKSWLMLDIGIAVAAGRYCLGESKCEQGDVLYLALEDNERRLQRRITKILGAFSTEWPTEFQYATDWPRANEGGVEAIRDWIVSAKNPRLVVVDVLAMFRPRSGNRDNLYEAATTTPSKAYKRSRVSLTSQSLLFTMSAKAAATWTHSRR
jgi:hypothetical protein